MTTIEQQASQTYDEMSELKQERQRLLSLPKTVENERSLQDIQMKLTEATSKYNKIAEEL